MKTSPIAVALRAKGPFNLYQRSRSIARRYGFTTARMDQALKQFCEVLQRAGCGATFPITAISLNRHLSTISRYLDQDIEFAVHGYTHVDYAQLAPETQLAHLRQAREVFARAGISPLGFRSPYLGRNDHLYAALEAAGFTYASNRPVLWDIADIGALAPAARASYERALAFYDPWRASDCLSLPCTSGSLVEIPVSLPDDEILIERLGGAHGLVTRTWLHILSRTHKRGELFTLQLHPERIAQCAASLSTVLAEARAMTPAVWCACLRDIAAWWRALACATVEIADGRDGCFDMKVSGPLGTTILARAVQVASATETWADGYQQIKARTFTVLAPLRPCIGLSPAASPALASFLRGQGYIVEISEDRHGYAQYFDQLEFAPEDARQLIGQIEQRDLPLVRLGRWPAGARSALAITGDIDALTLWDYGLRLIGK
jgi:peptidoglycan/xylan/chitin deacetylase (PgdA/CDA1 family)